ncbi:hypothetical protein Tco_0240989 [Tanacetum coccineum]
MLLDSILHGPFQYKVVDFPASEAMIIPTVTRMQTFTNLTPKEKIRKEYDIKAANIILHRLPNDIYTFLIIIQLPLKSGKGETIQYYYMRFAKLMNDINIIGLEMKPLQVNTKFVNHLQPEWSRFVIGVKQAKELHKLSFDQLCAYLKHNEQDANEVRAMRARFPYPLALIANTYNLPPSYSSFKSQYNPPMPVAAKQPYIQQPSYEPHAIYQ